MAGTGPLAVRWLACKLGEVRAGTLAEAHVGLENAGTVAWRSRVRLSYHWLDGLGNPIVWDGLRTPLERDVAPGETLRATLRLRGPIPPGGYRLALDLVDEGRAWFGELGSVPLELDREVAPRIERALSARGGDPVALAAQEEPLVDEDEAAAVAHLGDGVAPPPDWSRRVLDAHQEGYAVVAGSIEITGGRLGRRPRELEPYAPGGGRIPAFAHPLVCPSHVRGLVPHMAEPVLGLPAVHAPTDEPWLYDGRIMLTARPRSGRRRG